MGERADRGPHRRLGRRRRRLAAGPLAGRAARSRRAGAGPPGPDHPGPRRGVRGRRPGGDRAGRRAGARGVAGGDAGRAPRRRAPSATLAGKPRTPFRYFDKGSFAVIGRGAAVGSLLNRFKLTGAGGLAGVAVHPPLLPDRLSQPPAGADRLGLLVPVLPQRGPPHHRRGPPRTRCWAPRQPIRSDLPGEVSVDIRHATRSFRHAGSKRPTGTYVCNLPRRPARPPPGAELRPHRRGPDHRRGGPGGAQPQRPGGDRRRRPSTLPAGPVAAAAAPPVAGPAAPRRAGLRARHDRLDDGPHRRGQAQDLEPGQLRGPGAAHPRSARGPGRLPRRGRRLRHPRGTTSTTISIASTSGCSASGPTAAATRPSTWAGRCTRRSTR